jgi:sugar phosphate isomerase/epimerase
MKLSTSTNITAFTPHNVSNNILFNMKMCKKAGYEVIDINFCEAMAPFSRLKEDDWEDYILEIKELAKELDLSITQSHLPYYDIGLTNDKKKIDDLEEWIRRSIIASGMLNAKNVVTHPFTIYDDIEFTRTKDENLKYFEKHLKLAKENDVILCLENLFEYKKAPYQRTYCSTVTELCDLVDEFNSENVKICYDFGHANLVGGNQRQDLNIIGDRLKCLHVQDNDGISDIHTLPFYGTVNWEDSLKGLCDIGFDGDFTFEVQGFGKNLPNCVKPSMMKHTVEIGNILLKMHEEIKSRSVQ